jgi:hypothetical protein
MHRSRRGSTASEYDAEEWVDSGIGASIAGDDRPANIREASDDEGDVLNGVYHLTLFAEALLTGIVGLSRNPTEDPRDALRKQSAGVRRSSSVKQPSRPATGSELTRQASNPAQPFSAEELEQALQKSTLGTTREESDKSAEGSPYDDFEDPSPFLRPRGGSIYVPYNGQGTPPKLPFWGQAFPSCDDEMSSGHFSRRASVFLCNEEGTSTPQYERRESFFAPMHSPGPLQPRHASALKSQEDATSESDDEECVCQPEVEAEAEAPKRKPQPCAPCDAIAAILQRPD